MGLVGDHELRGGEDPTHFARATRVHSFNADGSVVVGASTFFPLGGNFEASEAFRWTDASGVVALGFGADFAKSDPRSLYNAPYCVSRDGSTVIGWSRRSLDGYSGVFRWTEASGISQLGQVPGTAALELRSASADCGVLLGGTVADSSSRQREAVRWSKTAGWTRLGWLPGDTGSDAVYVSADGAIVVGNSEPGHAFLWTEGSGMRSLGQLPGTENCTVFGGARDARVVVGNCFTATSSQVFRWTEATGMVSLGAPPVATGSLFVGGVSADGNVVVGDFVTSSEFHAFRWVQARGMVELEAPAGYEQTSLGPQNQRMNADGSVAVGIAFNPNGKAVTIRWSEGSGPVAFQPLPGDDALFVDGLSPDGAIAAGLSGRRDAMGVGLSVSDAVVWDASGVAHSVAAQLSAAGVDLNQFHLDFASAAPVRGQTVLDGLGKAADGSVRGWVAWFP